MNPTMVAYGMAIAFGLILLYEYILKKTCDRKQHKWVKIGEDWKCSRCGGNFFIRW